MIPDTGDAFGLDPVGVFIWKPLDETHLPEDIEKELRKAADEVPEKAGTMGANAWKFGIKKSGVKVGVRQP